MDLESKYNAAVAALALMREQRNQALDQYAELQQEVETLRRIRHLALSYREAVIECTWSFAAEPRERRYRRAVELDTLLGVEPPDWRGKM